MDKKAKIKTWEDFKKFTAKELFRYSDREDLTDEESDLFVSFCDRAKRELSDENGKIVTEQNETLEHYINRKNIKNEK